ncbi:MAG: L-seryl-tRNA(Sec) selenium transferase [Coriobacteriia bacterium]|nr:L-seryl-tRNA(Sec) selenium transferase [Coriobacteriia bacterium]
MDTQSRLRALPKVDDLLAHPRISEEIERHPRALVLDAVRDVIDRARAGVLSNESYVPDREHIVDNAVERISLKARRSLRRVINASGVIVHTNLGRSILSQAATEAVIDVAAGYSTLEYDVESGERGSRHVHVEDLICRMTGAEAAMAVNNNAAAVMLGIASLARGGEAVVSRGQLVEIGGSFRIPDIMAESGATMVEVGTTNKTHLRDYESAMTDRTKLLLRVHSSNFRVVGFTEEVELPELIELGAAHGVPVFEDQGSGVLIDLRPFGLPYEPTVGESIAAGVALVSCSGDKLLGGPQAGILAGRADIIRRLKQHPLARVLRLDKMTLAALEVTLRAYLDPERALREIPTLRMLTMTLDEVRSRAEDLAARIGDVCADHFEIDVRESIARAGGGALPMADIPTAVVAIAPVDGSVTELERRLRLGEPSVVARIKDDRLMLDLRTLSDEEIALVADAVVRVCCDGC